MPAAHQTVVSAAHAPSWAASALAGTGLRTMSAHDADEHAHNLTAWDQLYDQLSAGCFTGQLIELRLPQMQVFRESTSQALRQSCRVWADSFWFGLPDHLPREGSWAATRINGRLHGQHDIMVRPGDEPFELVTPHAHSLFGIVVQREALMAAAHAQGCQVDWDGLQHAELLHVQDAARSQCVQTLQMLLQSDQLVQDGMASVPASALQDAVLDAMLHMLDRSEVDTRSRVSFARRQSVVARARAHLLDHPDHPDQPVTVPELCQKLHVSRRTLQYCFEDVLGLSPMQYLRMIRLNGVRRHLRHAHDGKRSVQDIAAHWGFWHLSQFACDYRKLCGETPSKTLKAMPS